MKQYSKSVAVILGILCLVLFYVSFFGISTAYGDVTTDIINGAHLVPRGFGAAGSATLYMTANSTEETPEIDYPNGKRILENRLALANVAGHEVYAMPDSGGFAVRIPYDSYTSENIASLRRILVADGSFELRTEPADEDGNPAGEVVLTNRHIRNAQISVEASGTGYIYVIRLELTGEGKRLLAAAVEIKNSGAEPASNFSCRIGGSETETFSAAALEGATALQLTRGGGYSITTASETVTVLRTDPLGMAFTISAVNISENASVAGDNSFLMISAAFGAAVLAVGILLIVKYRVVGVCSLLSMLGSFSVMLFVFTNFGGSALLRSLSPESLGAFAVMLFVYFLAARRDAEGIRASLGGSLQKAVTGGLSRSFSGSAAVFALLFAMGLLTYDIFNRSGGWIVTVIRWVAPAFTTSNYARFSEFGMLLLVGAVSGLLFMLGGNRLMIRSTLGFKRFATEKNYGGAGNAAK